MDSKQIGSITLSAHPEAFELEKNGKRIFVNVPNSRHVAVIDRDKGEVVATWKTDHGGAPYPFATMESWNAAGKPAGTKPVPSSDTRSDSASSP